MLKIIRLVSIGAGWLGSFGLLGLWIFAGFQHSALLGWVSVCFCMALVGGLTWAMSEDRC